MIAWSLDAAFESGCFDRVIVSTDDEEIAEVARSNGAEVPFLRPPDISGEHAGTIQVVAHAIRWQQQHGVPPSQVCCVYATAPFLQAKDLQRGLGVLEQSGCDYAFAATSYAFPIQRAIRISAANRVEMFHPECFHTRSQDLEDAYHDAGQFYWGRASAWLSCTPIFSPRAAAVILPRYRVQDIDTPEDWVRAELMFTALRQQNGLK